MTARPSRQGMVGGLVVAVSIAVMNVTTYGLTLASARLLGPDQFGQFSSVLGVLIIVNVVSLALQATGARRVSTLPEDRHVIEARIMATTRRAALGVTALCLLLSPVLHRTLRLDSLWTALAMSIAAGFLCLMGGQSGILQGEQRWHSLSAIYAVMGTARLTVGLGALWIDRSAAAAIIGVAIAAAAPVVVGAWALRHPGRIADRPTVVDPPAATDRPWEKGSILREVAHSSHALFAFFAVSNIDILAARALLPAHDAGLYAAGLVLTKAVLFLPQFVVVVLFPAMARTRRGRQIHLLGLGAILALGGLASGMVAALPGLAQTFVGGAAYSAVAPRLWLFAALGTVLAMIQLLVYGALAQSRPRAVYILWAGLLATVVGAFQVHDADGLLRVKLAVDLVVLLALANYLLLARHDDPPPQTAESATAGEGISPEQPVRR